jgi:hypothetical protein
MLPPIRGSTAIINRVLKPLYLRKHRSAVLMVDFYSIRTFSIDTSCSGFEDTFAHQIRLLMLEQILELFRSLHQTLPIT